MTVRQLIQDLGRLNEEILDKHILVYTDVSIGKHATLQVVSDLIRIHDGLSKDGKLVLETKDYKKD